MKRINRSIPPLLINNCYSRRKFLSRIGGAAAISTLSPFVPLLESQAQESKPLRYLYWYTPVNPVAELVNKMLPAKEGKLEWRGSYQALNAMKDKMSLFRGLTNTVAHETNNAGVGGGHRPSGLTMLAGWAAKKEKLAGDTALTPNGAGFHGHSTLDQWLATRLRDEKNILTPLRDIRMGYRCWAHENAASWQTVSYLKGVAQLRLSGPDAMFKTMFSQTAETTQNNGGGYRKSVLDFSYKELERFQIELGYDDRQRLEQHLNAIREVEKKLVSTKSACELDSNLEQAASEGSAIDKAVELYTQLIAIAFSCDLTRIAGAQWLSHLTDNVWKGYKSPYSFLPEFEAVRQDHHGTTHDSGKGTKAQKEAFLNAISTFRAETFTKLCQSLDSLRDANGSSVLDNSIVHWYTDVSSDHLWFDQFNVIAGGGGYFKMGQHSIVGSTEKSDTWSQTRLLTSIANAFNFDINHFGDANYDNGALPSEVLVT